LNTSKRGFGRRKDNGGKSGHVQHGKHAMEVEETSTRQTNRLVKIKIEISTLKTQRNFKFKDDDEY
jgi:hypothetical protein